MNKKILIGVLVCVAFLLAGSLVNRTWFVEKVMYPGVLKIMDKGVSAGVPFRVASAQLDSVWKPEMKYMILIASALSTENQNVMEELFTNQSVNYNKNSTLVVLANSSIDKTPFEKYNLTTLSLQGQEKDYLFLNQTSGIQIADVVHEDDMYRIGFKHRYN